MAKPHIDKKVSHLINDSSDKLVTGGNLTKPDVDLFYEIEPAEVIKLILTDTDLQDLNLLVEGEIDLSFLGSVVCRRVYTENNENILRHSGDAIKKYIAKPLDSNFVKLPIVGELVPIINFLDSDSTKNIYNKNSFYLNSINAWNSPHHNAVPNISTQPKKDTESVEGLLGPEDGNPFVEGEELPNLGEFFTERGDIKRTQVYEGDVLLEGRFGQHIRLGSSDKVKSDNPNWWSEGSDETLGKPVTIISNGQSLEKTSELEPRSMYSSDFNLDSSTIILTENQPSSLDVSYLELDNEDAILKTLNFDLIGDTQNSTIQANSGTILLNAKSNKLLGFAKEGIGLITTGDMSIDVTNNWSTVSDNKDEEMGTSYKMTTPKADFVATKSTLGESSSKEPMVKGDKLVKVLAKLIDAIPKYIFVGGGGPHLNQAGNPGEILHKQLKTQLKTILSKNHTLD